MQNERLCEASLLHRDGPLSPLDVFPADATTNGERPGYRLWTNTTCVTLRR